MKFALHFADFASPEPERARRVAVAAERAGFESMFCIEQVVIPSEFTAGCPDVLGGDPLGAVAQRSEIGVGRIAVPGMAFAEDPERQIGELADRVIVPAG